MEEFVHFCSFFLLCPHGEGEMGGEKQLISEAQNSRGWQDGPAPSAVTYSRAVSSQVLSIPKDGDFPTSLGHLCQCLASLTAFDL